LLRQARPVWCLTPRAAARTPQSRWLQHERHRRQHSAMHADSPICHHGHRLTRKRAASFGRVSVRRRAHARSRPPSHRPTRCGAGRPPLQPRVGTPSHHGLARRGAASPHSWSAHRDRGEREGGRLRHAQLALSPGAPGIKLEVQRARARHADEVARKNDQQRLLGAERAGRATAEAAAAAARLGTAAPRAARRGPRRGALVWGLHRGPAWRARGRAVHGARHGRRGAPQPGRGHACCVPGARERAACRAHQAALSPAPPGARAAPARVSARADNAAPAGRRWRAASAPQLPDGPGPRLALRPYSGQAMGCMMPSHTRRRSPQHNGGAVAGAVVRWRQTSAQRASPVSAACTAALC